MTIMKSPFIGIILALIVTLDYSCSKNPIAAFSYDPEENPEAGEDIKFYNESSDAKDYYWDFGNGLCSEEENPTMKFKPPGEYIVTLTVENGSHTDSTSKTILIYPPTILEIWIFNIEGEPLANGQVSIYDNYEDAVANRNILYKRSTDYNGYVSFSNLEAITYFVYFSLSAPGGNYYSGGSIGPLNQNKINSYFGFAYFYPNGSKKGTDTGNFIRKN